MEPRAFAPPLTPELTVAAGLFLRQSQGGRFLLLRGRKTGEWGFPKGHQYPGEDLVATALRETAEETGIGLVAITAPPHLLHYVLPSGRRKVVAYFPAHTAQDDVALSSEHQEHTWASPTEAVRLLAHPTLRRLFKAHLAC